MKELKVPEVVMSSLGLWNLIVWLRPVGLDQHYGRMRPKELLTFRRG